MAVTPATIAVALGRPTPADGSPEESQWQMWIDDALMLIQIRIDSITPTPEVDEARIDYVVREAVVAHIRNPDNATRVTTAVDDASSSREYRTSYGRVRILDEWWALLGLAGSGGGAFDIDTVSASAYHLPWCSLTMGANYCSCGADIAGFPIFELN